MRIRTIGGAAGLGGALAFCGGMAAAAPGGGDPAAPSPPSASAVLDGPYAHKNLAVYVVRVASSDARVFITLEEGLSAGTVVIREKGAGEGPQDRAEVNALEIENRSDRWLFLQAGDIVKGGKQDRTIGIDIAIAPHAPPKIINAFCVEHGRWRQGAAGGAFTKNTGIVSSILLKKSIQGDKSQQRVWEEVAKQEQKALQAVAAETPPAAAAAANPPPSSGAAQVRGPSAQPAVQAVQAREPRSGALSQTGTYNAIVEHDTIRAGREEYVKALLPGVQKGEDVLGVVVILNGEILAADVYASSALFRMLAPKLLDAYALEAVLGRDPKKADAAIPAREAVQAFLNEPAKSEAKDEAVAGSMHRRTRDAARAVMYEYYEFDKDGKAAPSALHKNVLAQ